jgi:hypothetical protein
MPWISVIGSPGLVCVPLSAYTVCWRRHGVHAPQLQEADPTLPTARRRADCRTRQAA